MTKKECTQVSINITKEQIILMLNNAKKEVVDWTKPSSLNKGMTIGTSWNILTSGILDNYDIPTIIIVKLLREFGDYLPNELKMNNNKKINKIIDLVHQEPNFNNTI